MIAWLYQKLINMRSITPDISDDAICKVPGCANKAVDQWHPATCSLRESGVEVGWIPVCSEHDIQCNEQTVRFFFGDKYDDELAAYRSRRTKPE